MIDWLLAFKKAVPGPSGVTSVAVSNRSPSPSQGSRNIFKEDHEAILAYAEQFGFRRVSLLGDPIINFVKY